jgi:hypothetical protein
MKLRDFAMRYDLLENNIHVFAYKYQKKNNRFPKWYIKASHRCIMIDDALLIKIEQVKTDLWSQAVDCINFLESHTRAKKVFAHELQKEYGWSNLSAYAAMADAILLPRPNTFFLKVSPRAIAINKLFVKFIPIMIEDLKINDRLDIWFQDFGVSEIKNMELLSEI